MFSFLSRSLLVKILLPTFIITTASLFFSSYYISKNAKESLVVQSGKSYVELAEEMVADLQTLNGYSTIVLEQLFNQFEDILQSQDPGRITIDSSKSVKTGEYSAPAIYLGNELLNNNYSHVDRFTKVTKGSVATLFVRVGDDFLRVSTSLKKEDGLRAVGTFLGKNHPGYENLINGTEYVGKTILFGTNYITKYEPIIRDSKTVAVLFTGFNIEKQLDNLREHMSATAAQKDAWAYIYSLNKNNYGYPILEPNVDERKGFNQRSVDGEKIFEKMASLRNGILEYKRIGNDKLPHDYIGYFGIFGEWQWLVCIEIEKDILGTVSLSIEKTLFGLGLVSAVFTMVIIAIFITIATRGIVELTRQVEEARESGKLGTIRVIGNDEVARLARTFNALQSELRAHQEVLEQKVIEAVEESRKKDLMLAKKSKASAMTEMMGNVAHQWRQPLNALSLNIQSIKVMHEIDALSDEEITNVVEESKRLIEHMSQTIEDFRNFIKEDRGRVIFSLNTQINKTIELSRKVLEQNEIEIRFDADEEIECIGLPNEFSQVLMNLLSNAKDAFISNNTINRHIVIHLYKKGHMIYISHLDNAGGIPDSVVEHVFDPYFTTKHKSQGTGLGLYMSKMLLEDGMAGSISVTNKDDGAEFLIEIDSAKIMVLQEMAKDESGKELDINKQLEGII